MDNTKIAKLLRNAASAYQIKDETKYRFQIFAYLKAADSIQNSTREVKDLYSEKKLEEIPGVGPSIRSHIEDLLKSGKSEHLDNLLKGIPDSMFPLLDIPSFGPKKAFKLVTVFKLNNPETVIDDLEKLGKENKISVIDGFGDKSQKEILQSLNEFKIGKTKDIRMPLSFAFSLSEQIIEYLEKLPKVEKIYTLGSLRRMRETIGDLDFAVQTNDSEAVLDNFIKFPYTTRIIQKGKNDASILISSGKRVDLRTQPKESMGSLLQHFTGSKNHNIRLREYAQKKGLSLSEYGIKSEKNNKLTKFETEEKFYNYLGLDYIEPELREDKGEIELALQKKLPKLIELKNIMGDFHLHSSFPIEPSHDLGRNTLEEMVKKAISLNYSYLGFSEHNPSSSKHTLNETNALLLKRSKEIDHLMSKYSIRIFSLLETDILASGELGINSKSLDLIDGTIVSIHSSFSMDKSQMTKRVLKGLSHPKAKILAHPTGRLINSRPGFDLFWDEIFDFCVKNNKALEINSSPYRLDLPDSLIKPAIEKGVKFFINTDSHSVSEMDLMRFGVSLAKRGWTSKNDIINSYSLEKVEKWFKNT